MYQLPILYSLNTSATKSANIHSNVNIYIEGDPNSPKIKYAIHAPPIAPQNYASQ